MSDDRPLDTILDWVRKIAATPGSIPDYVREALSRIELRWQEGRPTESGWFWLSNYESRVDPFIDYVHKGEGGLFTFDDSEQKMYQLDLVQWFAGPIPEPNSHERLPK